VDLRTSSKDLADEAWPCRACRPADLVGSFDDVLKSTYREAARAVSGVEEANRQVALGTADVDAVATTVADAEVMLETLVTIRDKLVTAYNDLVRTPV